MKLIKAIAVLSLAIIVSTPAIAAERHPISGMKVEPLTVHRAAEKVTELDVELALTREQNMKGYMFREEIPDGTGMMFVVPKPREVGFWMKNTLLPLDMIFIDESGCILKIHPNAVPGDLTTIHSDYIIKAVLEIRGGQSEKLDIRQYDRVSHRIFRHNSEDACQGLQKK